MSKLSPRVIENALFKANIKCEIVDDHGYYKWFIVSPKNNGEVFSGYCDTRTSAAKTLARLASDLYGFNLNENLEGKE